MRRRFACLALAMAALIAFALGVPAALASDEADREMYFYDPEGGRDYHKQRDCATVSPGDWQRMVEISATDLTLKLNDALMPCAVCVMGGGAGRYTLRYQSPYDTAAPGYHADAAGEYAVGAELLAGLYTAVSDAACDGTLGIAAADGRALHSYALQGETSYTFYLGEGMRVTIPAHCALRTLAAEPLFQDDGAQTTVRQARYITMSQLPGRKYCLAAIPGQTGYAVLSTIAAETGDEPPARLELADGETKTVDLRERYDVFVELVNCVIWASEAGEG